MRKVNKVCLCLQFASEMRPEVVRDISKSVLRKSRLHKLHAFMEKKLGDRNVYNDKSDYWIRKRKIEEVVRSFALRVDEAIRTER